MKKVMAVTIGFLVAFVPAGTALAGDGPKGTAWGNCKTSAAGGRDGAEPAPGGVANGRGFGGHDKGGCEPDPGTPGGDGQVEVKPDPGQLR